MLLFVLFFLCCMLLCSSVLVLNLSNQFQASSEMVQKEQSRLLAYSGWNLALEQLQLYGTAESIQRTPSGGELVVEFQKSSIAPSAWEIVSTGTSGVYSRNTSGIVQCFYLPFAHTETWPVVETLQGQTDAGIILPEEEIYYLQSDCMYGLGIASVNQMPITVAVTEEIQADALYIHGDLHVSGTLTANCIYVSGEISGAEDIQCDAVYQGCAADMLYQIRVLERKAV